MYLVSSPLKVKGKSKEFTLNLNQYRNAHYYLLNDSKIAYKAFIKSQIDNLPVFNKVRLKYVVWSSTKRKFDVSNICSIVDKYFSDALVELGKLPDDNYDYIDEVSYRYGGLDKDNPRVDIIIEPV